MFIKNIIYINLDYRKDRLEQIKEQMQNLINHYLFKKP